MLKLIEPRITSWRYLARYGEVHAWEMLYEASRFVMLGSSGARVSSLFLETGSVEHGWRKPGD